LFEFKNDWIWKMFKFLKNVQLLKLFKPKKCSNQKKFTNKKSLFFLKKSNLKTIGSVKCSNFKNVQNLKKFGF
jgi:hypothetical protein